MTSFVPLNVIPDSDSEGEVDNTEEIQIEEALKVYQRALRLHTDGAWEDAQKAYEDLFRSEIFQLDVFEELHGNNRTVASSLPLVQYLAYKNHGAFKLDRLKAKISDTTPEDIQTEVSQALEWYSTALDRDAGDSSLWRQTSQLAIVLSSARLARFALESILDHNTVGADSSKDALSLVTGGNHNPEDHLALLQLLAILDKICDTETLSNTTFQRLTQKKLHPRFVKCLNPIRWLPVPQPGTIRTLKSELDRHSAQKQPLVVASRTWSAVGNAILEHLPKEAEHRESEDNQAVVTSVQFLLPACEGDEDSRDTTPGDESLSETNVKSEVVIADETDDVSMTDASGPPQTGTSDRRRSGSAARKRKSTSMGADASRSRLSKRQRDKKEADAAAAAAAAATPESKQKVRQETQDEKLFNTVYDCLAPFGLSIGTAASLKIKPASESGILGDPATDSAPEKCELYIEDFKTILQTWDDDKGNVILYGDGIQSPAEAAQGMRFLDLEANVPNRPVLAGDEGLRKWIKKIHSHGFCVAEVAFEWLKALCRRDTEHPTGKNIKRSVSVQYSSWVKHTWPEPLKFTAMDIARNSEETCYQFFRVFEQDLVFRRSQSNELSFTCDDYATIEWAETMLEIYLDDLAVAERNRSGGDITSEGDDGLEVKRERVFRWAYLVGDLMQYRPRDKAEQLEEDQLTLRYLWAKVVITGFSDPSREFRLKCFEELKDVLAPYSPIDLPNCSVMPEVSSGRAEREISKLKTVDFFSTIFMTASETNEKDPNDVIEILEAILEPGVILPYDEEEERILQDIGRFFEGSSAMFKLHLWEKLKFAYEKINNVPKILSCTLKCMQIVMSELVNRSYVDSSKEHRQFVLLRSLRLVDGMVFSVLATMLKEPKISDTLQKDEAIEALQSTMCLLRILHCYSLWESAVMKSEAKASDLHSYRLVVVKFRELLVRGWVLSYLLYSALLKMGLGLENGQQWEPGQREEKLAGLLRDLHEELGARHYCKLANHMFLKLMFEELLRFDNPDLRGDLLQCIQCRFHMILCSDQWYLFDHKTDPEPLDRPTAMRLIDFILFLASQKKVLQLPKSEIKIGLDKLVEVLGVPHRLSNNRVFHNESVIDQYLKSSINPLRLFGCLKGELALSTVAVGGYYNLIASKGLYFLQGKTALFPLRYQKKTGALKGDDIETAIQYFKYDVVCNTDGWETWYRIAQTFEIQMEEAQTWSADAINTRRSDLVALERRTILSYMMAASLATHHSDPNPENLKSMSEMYTDFGYRIYAASRPPMAMESFWVDGFDRHYSGRNGEGMYRSRPHTEISLEVALKFAFVLFQHALAHGGEDNWKNHYMMGKCMGKLYNISKIYSPETVLAKYVDALEHCPEKTGNDYIFEPHHKLVSVATKLVLEEVLQPKRACEILEASHFTRRIEHVDDHKAFVHYAIEVLKKMKSADKPKWHHRMTNRLAKLKYECLNDVVGARAELSSLFSNKAAQLSIWRPEFERSGRHFVFASQYTMFYVILLEKLGDRATLEILAKRVRKVSNGLFRHSDVWNHVFQAYINVLRTTGQVPTGREDEVFGGISFDDFTTYSQRLDLYCNLPDTKSSTLELLREVFELRKLNSALAKNPTIDDLLADTYAMLYAELVPEILKQLTQENENRANPMSLKNLMADSPPVDSNTTNSTPASQSRVDDLPMRGKLTKVTRRELISKASNLCKELNLVPNSAAKSVTVTAPNSPRMKLAMPNSPAGSVIADDPSTNIEEAADLDIEMSTPHIETELT